MIASDLITNHVPPVKSNETIEKALFWMDEFRVNHLPVLEGKELVGVVSDAMIFDYNDLEDEISKLSFIGKIQFVRETSHLFKVMEVITDHNLSVVPVLNSKNEYVGAISSTHLIHVFSNQLSLKEKGAVIVLEMNTADYQLSQVAQIVESNNAKILSTYLGSSPDSNQLSLTIKLNQAEINPIIQTFNRYDYTIKNIFTDQDFDDEFQHRLDNLMNYLKL
jgi:CBS domain-containing protein